MLKKIINKVDINKEFNRWIISDIEKIIKICKENKIKLFLQNYPTFLKEPDLLYNIAQVNSVPFINNYQIFEKLRNRGKVVDDYYFLPDGHCNAKGYAIMARNIFDKIMEEKSFN